MRGLRYRGPASSANGTSRRARAPGPRDSKPAPCPPDSITHTLTGMPPGPTDPPRLPPCRPGLDCGRLGHPLHHAAGRRRLLRPVAGSQPGCQRDGHGPNSHGGGGGGGRRHHSGAPAGGRQPCLRCVCVWGGGAARSLRWACLLARIASLTPGHPKPLHQALLRQHPSSAPLPLALHAPPTGCPLPLPTLPPAGLCSLLQVLPV